jgi:acetaldehyde dehydrogenase
MAAAVQQYVPGYRLKQKVQFDRLDSLNYPRHRQGHVAA